MIIYDNVEDYQLSKEVRVRLFMKTFFYISDLRFQIITNIQHNFRSGILYIKSGEIDVIWSIYLNRFY